MTFEIEKSMSLLSHTHSVKAPLHQYKIIYLILQRNVNLWPNPEFVTISPKMWICDKVPSKLLSGRSVAVGVLFSYWGYSGNSFRHLHTRLQNQFHSLEFIFQIFYWFWGYLARIRQLNFAYRLCITEPKCSFTVWKL